MPSRSPVKISGIADGRLIEKKARCGEAPSDWAARISSGSA